MYSYNKMSATNSLLQMENLEKEKFAIHDNRKFITDFGLYLNIHPTEKIKEIVQLVIRDKMPWALEEKYEINRTFACTSHVSIQQADIFTRVNTTLVLAPPTELSTWMQQFMEEKELRIAKVTLKNIAENIDINEYDVVIIAPEHYNSLVTRHHNTAWKRFIFDQAHHIKVRSMAPITAGFNWYLTFFPEILHDTHRTARTSFMQDISYSARYYNLFMVKAQISDSPYATAFKQVHTYPCIDLQPQRINLPDLLKAKNFKAITRIYRGRFSTDPIKDIYTYKNALLQTKDDQEEMRIISTQMDNIESRLKDYAEKECPICHEQVKNPLIEMTCMNVFCAECLYTWLIDHNQCPYCKKYNCFSSLLYVSEEKEDKSPTRLKRIIDFLGQKGRKKVAIYSELSLGSLLKEQGSGLKIEDITKDHQTEKIEKKLNKFYNGTANILIFNYNNCYIDLSSITDLICYQSCNSHENVILQSRLGSNRPTLHTFVSSLA